MGQSEIETLDPLLHGLLMRAQNSDDTEAGLALLRKYGEMLSRQIAPQFGLEVAEYESWVDLLASMQRKCGRKNRKRLDELHRLRKSGNLALHSAEAPPRSVLDARIVDANALAGWYASLLGVERKGETAAENSGEAVAGNSIERALVVRPMERSAPSGFNIVGGSWAQLANRGIALADALGDDSFEVRTALAEGIELIAASRAPFRLGIVGEMRVGKSTLINALAGADLAPVGEVETTHLITCYRHGETGQATFRFVDGREEVMSVAEARKLMIRHRDDSKWSATVDYVDVVAPCPRMGAIELWDAPGLGGSDENEAIANRFIDIVGGAVWLFDADVLGDDTVMGPLRRLSSSGKTILGAINRVDELDTDQRAEATSFMREMCGDLVCDVVGISALEMLNGNHAERESFVAQIDTHILQSSEADRTRRVHAAIGHAGHTCATRLAACVRRLRDRAGLVALLRDNITAARQRTLTGLGEATESIANQTFRQQERRAGVMLNELFVRANGSPTAKAVDRLITQLDESTHLHAEWPRAVAGMADVVEKRWVRYTNEAITLTRAAVPSFRFERVSVPQIQAQQDSYSRDVSRDAEDRGIVAGGLGAAILGIVAAASITVTWPVMFAAIPFGLMMAERESVAGMQRRRITHASIQAQMGAMLDSKRAVLKHAMDCELPEYFVAVLDAQVAPILRRVVTETLGTNDIPGFQADLQSLETVVLDLQTDVEAHLGADHSLGAIVQPGDIAIPAGAGTGLALAGFLSQMHGGLDVITQGAERNVAAVLVHLRAGLDVRWVSSGRCTDATRMGADMRGIAGNWPGRLGIRVVSDEDGQALALPDVTFISPSGAWWCSANAFARLGTLPVVFQRVPLGLLAAQHRFSELWTGLSNEGHLQVEVA